MWSLGMPCAWHFAAKGQLSAESQRRDAEGRDQITQLTVPTRCLRAHRSVPLRDFFFLSFESKGQSVPSPPPRLILASICHPGAAALSLPLRAAGRIQLSG